MNSKHKCTPQRLVLKPSIILVHTSLVHLLLSSSVIITPSRLNSRPIINPPLRHHHTPSRRRNSQRNRYNHRTRSRSRSSTQELRELIPRVNTKHHTLLAMHTLHAEEPKRRRHLDLEVSEYETGFADCVDLVETGVEAASEGLAGLEEGRLRYGVVGGVEVETDYVADCGDDLVVSVFELAVGADDDMVRTSCRWAGSGACCWW